MRVWISVDDTDMPGTKGTGWLLEDICKGIEKMEMGRCSAVSRHQLFVHEDVPFTSHNSAMCVRVDLEHHRLPDLTRHMIHSLETRSQKGADPGLCICRGLESNAMEKLIAFGRAAKKRICTKNEAYGLASDLGLHLTEHGGTGEGVIGALAGMGLRLSGDDGRYRGWYALGNPGEVIGVATLCAHPNIKRVVLDSGRPLPLDAKICIGSEKTKTVRLGREQVVVATENQGDQGGELLYRTITKQEAKQY